MGELRRPRPPHRRRPPPPRAAPRRHARADAHQPPGVPPRRRGRHAPRRDPVLDVQHLLARAGRLPAARLGREGRRRRGAVPRPRRRRDRDRRRAPRRARAGRRLRLRRRLAGGRARRPADADLHLGHDRRPQGRRAHAQEHAVHDARLRRGAAVRARRPRHLLPADGAHRGAQLLALLPDAVRLHGHLLPERARGHELLPRGAAVVVLRRAADLREAQGGDRVRPRRKIRPPSARSSGWTSSPRSTSAPPRARPR